MATIAHWKGDKFDKEYLFWDNQTFMKQIGLATLGKQKRRIR